MENFLWVSVVVFYSLTTPVMTDCLRSVRPMVNHRGHSLIILRGPPEALSSCMTAQVSYITQHKTPDLSPKTQSIAKQGVLPEESLH